MADVTGKATLTIMGGAGGGRGKVSIRTKAGSAVGTGIAAVATERDDNGGAVNHYQRWAMRRWHRHACGRAGGTRDAWFVSWDEAESAAEWCRIAHRLKTVIVWPQTGVK